VLQQIARGQRKLAKIEVPEAVMVDAARLCSAVGVDGLRGELTLMRAGRAYAALKAPKPCGASIWCAWRRWRCAIACVAMCWMKADRARGSSGRWTSCWHEPDAMSEGLADALIAARLLARSPGPLGGLCLRGCGPAVDRVLEALAMLLPPGTPLRRLPGHIDEERLCGGTDIAASLAGRHAGAATRLAGGSARRRAGGADGAAPAP
jgi:hypothetical protein